MITITLTAEVRNLNGDVLKETNGSPVTLGKTLANFLASENSQEPAKYIGWAMSLMKDGVIQVDQADHDKLLASIKANKSMTNLLKAQLINEFGT